MKLTFRSAHKPVQAWGVSGWLKRGRANPELVSGSSSPQGHSGILAPVVERGRGTFGGLVAGGWPAGCKSNKQAEMSEFRFVAIRWA